MNVAHGDIIHALCPRTSCVDQFFYEEHVSSHVIRGKSIEYGREFVIFERNTREGMESIVQVLLAL